MLEFYIELNDERVPVRLVKSLDGLTLTLWDITESANPKFLGDLIVNNLLLTVNREKLRCKYGHPIEVAKRKKVVEHLWECRNCGKQFKRKKTPIKCPRCNCLFISDLGAITQ